MFRQAGFSLAGNALASRHSRQGRAFRRRRLQALSAQIDFVDLTGGPVASKSPAGMTASRLAPRGETSGMMLANAGPFSFFGRGVLVVIIGLVLLV